MGVSVKGTALPAECLDLRYAAVSIGELYRHHSGCRREFKIGLRVRRNRHRVLLIARRHRDGPVRDRGVKSDADLPDSAAIRHQVCVINEQAVKFAESEPTPCGHLEDFALFALKRADGLEAYGE